MAKKRKYTSVTEKQVTKLFNLIQEGGFGYHLDKDDTSIGYFEISDFELKIEVPAEAFERAYTMSMLANPKVDMDYIMEIKCKLMDL